MDIRRFATAKMQSPFWRRVGVLAAGTMVSHALLFLSFPIVGLLYNPSQFGAYALYGALLAFAGIFATLRYEIAIPIAKRRREAVSLVALALLGTVAVSATVIVAFVIFGGWLNSVFDSTSLSDLAMFLAMGCAAEGLVRTLRAWNLRHGNMPALASAKVSQSCGVVVGQILLYPFGHIGLYVSDLVGRFGSAVAHWCFAWRNNELPLQPRKQSTLVETAKRYRRFPLYSTWAAVCIQFVDCSPLILLSAIYSSSTAGAFAMAHRAVLGPLLVISMAITQAYVSEGAATIRDRPVDLPGLFWRTWKRMIRIGCVSVFLMAGMGAVLVQSVFSEQWHLASVFMLLLAPAILGQFVVGPIYQTLDILQEQKWALVVNAVGLVMVVAVFCCAKILQWPATQAVAIYSVVVLIYNACLFFCAAHAVRRFQNKLMQATASNLVNTGSSAAA